MAHAHTHDHHDHHGHAHHHAPAPSDKRYSIAIGLNLTFVVIEGAAAFFANSTALFSDAAHNLSDVLGLALAGGAAWLATRQASARRTYGYAKATVLAALANALVLVGACGAILWEAIERFMTPHHVEAPIVMITAAIGVLLNGATALLFMRGRAHDVNARGAFLHMLGDAGVSAGVILAAGVIALTNASWIDPLVSCGVVALILWTTWGLLRESLDLAMDAAPAHIDVAAVRTLLARQDGVSAVHDLHIWAMGARECALTAHLVRAEGGDDAFLLHVAHELEHAFGICHATLQVEREHRDNCGGHA
ncbi:MAG: cation diffusion facilitator family transporter [Pseudomonadota bacterium]